MDIQLFDDGQGVASITNIVDAAGLPAAFPPGSTTECVSSDPSVVVSGISADGLSAIFAPATPPVLSTGVVLTMKVTFPNNADGTPGKTISEDSDPLDVVGDAASGFKVSLATGAAPAAPASTLATPAVKKA